MTSLLLYSSFPPQGPGSAFLFSLFNHALPPGSSSSTPSYSSSFSSSSMPSTFSLSFLQYFFSQIYTDAHMYCLLQVYIQCHPQLLIVASSQFCVQTPDQHRAQTTETDSQHQKLHIQPQSTLDDTTATTTGVVHPEQNSTRGRSTLIQHKPYDDDNVMGGDATADAISDATADAVNHTVVIDEQLDNVGNMGTDAGPDISNEIQVSVSVHAPYMMMLTPKDWIRSNVDFKAHLVIAPTHQQQIRNILDRIAAAGTNHSLDGLVRTAVSKAKGTQSAKASAGKGQNTNNDNNNNNSNKNNSNKSNSNNNNNNKNNNNNNSNISKNNNTSSNNSNNNNNNNNNVNNSGANNNNSNKNNNNSKNNNTNNNNNNNNNNTTATTTNNNDLNNNKDNQEKNTANTNFNKGSNNKVSGAVGANRNVNKPNQVGAANKKSNYSNKNNPPKGSLGGAGGGSGVSTAAGIAGNTSASIFGPATAGAVPFGISPSSTNLGPPNKVNNNLQARDASKPGAPNSSPPLPKQSSVVKKLQSKGNVKAAAHPKSNEVVEPLKINPANAPPTTANAVAPVPHPPSASAPPKGSPPHGGAHPAQALPGSAQAKPVAHPSPSQGASIQKKPQPNQKPQQIAITPLMIDGLPIPGNVTNIVPARRLFGQEIQCLMHSFGEVRYCSREVLELMEDAIRDRVRYMTLLAAKISASSDEKRTGPIVVTFDAVSTLFFRKHRALQRFNDAMDSIAASNPDVFPPKQARKKIRLVESTHEILTDLFHFGTPVQDDDAPANESSSAKDLLNSEKKDNNNNQGDKTVSVIEDMYLLCTWRANFALKQFMSRQALNDYTVCRSMSFVRGEAKHRGAQKAVARIQLFREWLEFTVKDAISIPEDALYALGHVAWEITASLTQHALMLMHYLDVQKGLGDPRADSWSFGRHILSGLSHGIAAGIFVPINDLQLQQLKTEMEAVDGVSSPTISGISRWRGFGRKQLPCLLPYHVKEAIRTTEDKRIYMSEDDPLIV